MSTAVSSFPFNPESGESASYRFTCGQFDTMIESGVFGAEDVELLEGTVYPVTTGGERHQLTVERIARLLRGILPDADWHVREEKHVQIEEHWKPRPDVHVVRGSFESYWRTGRQPTVGDLVLLVEVCELTQERDEHFKQRGYALSGAPCYWFVDIRRRLVRVYTLPEAGGYASAVEYKETAALPLLIADCDWGVVAVSDLMPSWPRREETPDDSL